MTAGSASITGISDTRIAFTVIGSFLDGANLQLGTTTGTQIGTATSQKLAFYGAAPVVQQTGGAATASGSYTSTEQGMLNHAYAALRALGLLS